MDDSNSETVSPVDDLFDTRPSTPVTSQRSSSSSESQEANTPVHLSHHPDSFLLNDVRDLDPLARATVRRLADLSATAPVLAEPSLLREGSPQSVTDLGLLPSNRSGSARGYPIQSTSVIRDATRSWSLHNHSTGRSGAPQQYRSFSSNVPERYEPESPLFRDSVHAPYADRDLPTSPTKRRIAQSGTVEENPVEPELYFNSSTSEPTELSRSPYRLLTDPGNVLLNHADTSYASTSNGYGAFPPQPQPKRRRVIQEEPTTPDEDDYSYMLFMDSEPEMESTSVHQVTSHRPEEGLTQGSSNFTFDDTLASGLTNAHVTEGLFRQPPPSQDHTPQSDYVYLSHLIPRKYDSATRAQILYIFKEYAPYVPLCIMKGRDDTDPERGTYLLRHQRAARDRTKIRAGTFEPPLGPRGQGWPTNFASKVERHRGLAVEIFEHIGSFLPRDSIHAMRLVNREFEWKISRLAFKNVVVPFKPMLYGPATTDSPADLQGKYNPKKHHVNDGMSVFEMWGPAIKKFALTFEVAQETLISLPPKELYDIIYTFWGSYRWPRKDYSRFEQAASLEQKADEFGAMTTAFSHLSGLKEFGLSILSGLGWQPGPDVSDRIKLFQKKPAVFGAHFALPDAGAREAMRAWRQIVNQQTQYVKHLEDATSRSFFRMTREINDRRIPAMRVKSGGKPNRAHPPIMFNGKNMEAEITPPRPSTRVVQPPSFRNGRMTNDHNMFATTPAFPFSNEPLVPNALKPDQEEWLMEMEWAQRAFLTSWCLALLDNPRIFETLRTFNIANISSKYLEELQREDIWRALPSLENLTVLVSPDWRQVCKCADGMVNTSLIMPSKAHTLFWSFLCTLFQEDRRIRILKVGYVDGGEHAAGMYARNHNVLPAPIMKFAEPRKHVTVQGTKVFSQIEQLTLSNCWITPEAVKIFFGAMEGSSLQELTFESVSLSARATNNGSPWDAAYTNQSDAWQIKEPVPGSWSAVLDIISPDQRISDARYLHGFVKDTPDAHMTSIKKIRFESCGYIKLTHMIDLDQSTIGDPAAVPACLRGRFVDLGHVMLESKDPYLGVIVPVITDEDAGCLTSVFGMRLGWPDERREKYDNREDGQCPGGEGRFSGVLG